MCIVQLNIISILNWKTELKLFEFQKYQTKKTAEIMLANREKLAENMKARYRWC